MQSAFPIVVFGAVAFSVVMAVAFLLTGRRSPGGTIYDQIGQGGLSGEADMSGAQPIHDRRSPADAPAAQLEREREVRQMLSARSERLVRKGQPALDIDAEVARLLQAPPSTTAHEPGL